jgi:hypothetical protein
MMASPQLGARDRRVLGLGALTISLLIGLSRGLPALRGWDSARVAAARVSAEQLAEVRGGMRALAELRDSLRARRLRLAAIDSVLPAASSPAGVAAAIATAIEELADDNDVRLTSLQLRADSTIRAGRVRVGVRVGGVADVAGLAALLRAVEGGEAPLAVRELSVSQPEPAAPDSKPGSLRFDMLVAGVGRIAPPARGAAE